MKTSTQKMAKNPLDLNAPYFCGMTPNQILEIVMLGTENTYNWATYDKKELSIASKVQQPHVFNDFQKGRFVVVSIPFFIKEGEYSIIRFDFRIYDDGYVLFENGGGCHIRHSNPLTVAALVAKHLVPRKGSNKTSLETLTIE